MTWEYSEDNLIEQTAINFFQSPGMGTLLAYNKESFGEGSTLGRLKKAVLNKIFFEKLKNLIRACHKRHMMKPGKNLWKKVVLNH